MTSYPYIWNYVPLALQILAALGVAAGMVGASFFIGKHKNSRTKLGAYECGMDPVGDARGRFSVRFYMVAMLFILFDVEAVFMLPWAVIFRRLPGITAEAQHHAITATNRWFGFWEMLVYIGFVAVGLFYVWKKGILTWAEDKGDL
jgi:NADH-quinone oxidoreductase subunit A